MTHKISNISIYAIFLCFPLHNLHGAESIHAGMDRYQWARLELIKIQEQNSLNEQLSEKNTATHSTSSTRFREEKKDSRVLLRPIVTVPRRIRPLSPVPLFTNSSSSSSSSSSSPAPFIISSPHGEPLYQHPALEKSILTENTGPKPMDTNPDEPSSMSSKASSLTAMIAHAI